MKSGDILLLAQLVDSMDKALVDLEASYEKQDKKKYDEASAALLDNQKKITFLLK